MQIRKIFVGLLLTLVAVLPLAAQDELKKVAVWETKCADGSVSNMRRFTIRAGMETAVGNTAGYKVYDRSAFDVIMKEQGFQRSGAVNDNEIKKMGELAGVQYIIVPEAMAEDGYIAIQVKMLDVELGEFGLVQDAMCADDVVEIKKTCVELGKRLFGGTVGGGVTAQPRRQAQGGQAGQPYTETAYGLNLRMVYVEGGTFTMGCTGEQGGECENDESPSRQTTVGSFYMGMLEVTQGQWEKVMGTTIYQQANKAGGSTYGTGPDYPMYYVSWEEAKEFCMRLSQQTGRTYRLPTEAEWEYAARGGKRAEGSKYSGGWSVGDVAWYDGNSGKSTHVCGTKRANVLGLYDMSGNVWEWCEDFYGPYLSYDTDNPRGASSGSNRLNRGGGWNCYARYCRVSYRCYFAPSNRGNNLGFRVVLVP